MILEAMHAVEDLSVQEKEDLLNILASKLAESYRGFTPLYPWVLVHTLPRDGQVGSIYLPQKHNKVQHEGIVLRTWTSSDSVSELVPGDHVLFAHFAGMPIPMWPDCYRIVRECDWQKDKDGGIYAKIEYAHDIRRDLAKLLSEHPIGLPMSEVDHILERYVLVDKQKKAVTLSGV